MAPAALSGLGRNLGDHEPVGRWLRGIEQWVAGPDVADVIQTQVGMFEEVTGLPVDFERPVIIEPIDVEPLHGTVILQPLTDDYSSVW